MYEDIVVVEFKFDGFWWFKLEGRVRSRELWCLFLVVINVVNEIIFVFVLFFENVRIEEKLFFYDNGFLCFNWNFCGVLVLYCIENLNGGYS